MGIDYNLVCDECKEYISVECKDRKVVLKDAILAIKFFNRHNHCKSDECDTYFHSPVKYIDVQYFWDEYKDYKDVLKEYKNENDS